jgi:hypothetical protein
MTISLCKCKWFRREKPHFWLNFNGLFWGIHPGFRRGEINYISRTKGEWGGEGQKEESIASLVSNQG